MVEWIVIGIGLVALAGFAALIATVLGAWS